VNRKRTGVLTLLFFLIIAFPAAAETVTLSLDDAVQRALDQSINLKKSSIDLTQSEYSASHLYSEIFPSFSLSAGLTFLPSSPLFTDPGFKYNNNALSYNLNFGLSLSLNPSLSSSMKRIELAYRSQLLKYDDAAKQLEIQVIKNFLYLITRQKDISNMEDSLRLAEEQMGRDKIAHDNGILSELAWLNSQFSVETARYNLSNSQGVYQNALEQFLALLGMPTGTDIIFEGTVDIVPISYDPEQLIQEYLPRRPDIQSQRQTIENLELAKNVTALTNRSPSLELGTQWQGGSPSNNTGGLGAPFSDKVSGTLTLRVPVDSWIPGTKSNQTVRSADADLAKALLDLQDTETQAKTQIRTIISNLSNTWISLDIARLRVDIAQRTAEATAESFQSGTVDYQTLETSRKDLSDARQQLLQGEYSYQSLLLDLAAALNMDWKTLTNQNTQAGTGTETTPGQ